MHGCRQHRIRSAWAALTFVWNCASGARSRFRLRQRPAQGLWQKEQRDRAAEKSETRVEEVRYPWILGHEQGAQRCGNDLCHEAASGQEKEQTCPLARQGDVGDDQKHHGARNGVSSAYEEGNRGYPDTTRREHVGVPKDDLGDNVLQDRAEYYQHEDRPTAVAVGQDSKWDGHDEAWQTVECIEHLDDGRKLRLDGAHVAVPSFAWSGTIVAAANDALQNAGLRRVQEEAGQVDENDHGKADSDDTALQGVSSASGLGAQQRPVFAGGIWHGNYLSLVSST